MSLVKYDENGEIHMYGTLLRSVVGRLIYFTSCQHIDGYIDGGSQRAIFPGGHPSNY